MFHVLPHSSVTLCFSKIQSKNYNIYQDVNCQSYPSFKLFLHFWVWTYLNACISASTQYFGWCILHLHSKYTTSLTNIHRSAVHHICTVGIFSRLPTWFGDLHPCLLDSRCREYILYKGNLTKKGLKNAILGHFRPNIFQLTLKLIIQCI